MIQKYFGKKSLVDNVLPTSIPWLWICASWIIYLPISFYLVAISMMRTGSGDDIVFDTAWKVFVGLYPLLIMIFMTRKAIVKRSKIFAILAVPAFIVPPIIIAIIIMPIIYRVLDFFIR